MNDLSIRNLFRALPKTVKAQTPFIHSLLPWPTAVSTFTGYLKVWYDESIDIPI